MRFEFVPHVNELHEVSRASRATVFETVSVCVMMSIDTTEPLGYLGPSVSAQSMDIILTMLLFAIFYSLCHDLSCYFFQILQGLLCLGSDVDPCLWFCP
jgi:hypothetical protein